MKKVICSLFVAISILVVGCSKGSSQSPVSEYVDYLNKATEIVESVNSIEDYEALDTKLEDIRDKDIFKGHEDFPLTDEDKEQIKVATSEFLHAVMNKTISYTGMDETQKQMMMQQIPPLIQASDMLIDQAKTLGELNVTGPLT